MPGRSELGTGVTSKSVPRVHHRRVTIRQVAHQLGLSTSTISKALSKPKMVKSETVARVQKEVERLGYRPNSIAQELRLGPGNNVFAFVQSYDLISVAVLDGIEAAALALGYIVMTANVGSNPLRQREYFDLASRGRAVGAIVISSNGLFAKHPQKANSYPTVFAFNADRRRNVASVSIDYSIEAENATKHLIELGHRRIAFIDSNEDDECAKRRYRGYRTAMASFGLGKMGGFSLAAKCDHEGGKSAMLALLKGKSAPTAVFIGSDELSVGALAAIRLAGLRVPEDISVIGFGGQIVDQLCDPPLTSVRLPALDIGYRAMISLDLILQGMSPNSPMILPCCLVSRGSTARPLEQKST